MILFVNIGRVAVCLIFPTLWRYRGEQELTSRFISVKQLCSIFYFLLEIIGIDDEWLGLLVKHVFAVLQCSLFTSNSCSHE